MADTDANVPQDGAPSDAPESRSGGIAGKLKVIGFLSVVVLVECVLAALVIPTAEETTAMAQAQLALAADPPEGVDNPDPTTTDPSANRREVDLGEFTVTSYQPLTNTTLRIDFHLYATVLTKDEVTLLELLADNQHRYREQVLVILRSSEITDLTEAGLGLIKRKILEKTNRTLGKALIQEIIFSDFSFIEQ